jgi:TolB-like protein
MTDLNLADRLDSWKEIASFLRRDVRTVQRWEKKEALPVHRHQHDKLGSVYAYRKELNEWFTTRQQSGAASELPRQSDKIKLAVLPFGVLGEDRQDDYFTDGLTEEMITQVTRLQPEQLAVIAHNSVLQYNSSSKSLQQMRHDLGVDYTLQGKVRRAGNRVRITAQLSEIQDQTQLWAETYERDLSDVLGVQAEIAQAIAAEIHVVLNLKESTRLADLQRGKQRVNAEAYDAYLRGRYHLHEMMPASIEKSVTEFARAIELDASYAPAYSGMAIASALLAIVPFDVAPPRDTMPRAEEAARKALTLDESLAEAHAALALVQHHFHWNWAEAEASYKRAIELSPDYSAAHLWYSWLLLAVNRREDAYKEIDITTRIVQETDPRRLVAVHATRAQALYFGREYERAVAECKKAQQLEPDHAMLHYILGRSYMRLDKQDDAIAQLKAASSGPGDFPLADAALGLAYAVAGRLDEAQKIGARFRDIIARRYIPPTYFGMLYAGMGDRDRAMVWLTKACAERADGLTWLAVEPMMDDIRADERFQEILEKLGLDKITQLPAKPQPS